MVAVPQFNTLHTGAVVAFNTVSYVQAYATTTGAIAERKLKYRSAGTISKFEVIVSANTIATSATTVRNTKNASNGAMSVSVTAGATGSFVDATNTETVAAGDDIAFEITTPNTSGSITISCVNTVFAATANTVHKLVCRNGSLGSGSTTYAPLAGGAIGLATEAQAQVKIKAPGTMQRLYCYITSNASGATSTLKSRVNGANGAMSLSIGAAATGQFEDTANSDTLAVNDLVNTQLIVGTSGSLSPGISAAVEFLTTNGATELVASLAAPTVNANVTNYLGLGSGSGPYSTEAPVQSLAAVAGSYNNLACYVGANTVTAASTLRFRKNGGNGNQSVSITASTTGYFEDATGIDRVLATDTVNAQIVTGATGTSLTLISVAMIGKYSTSLSSPARQSRNVLIRR